jgi:hypothetical protein
MATDTQTLTPKQVQQRLLNVWGRKDDTFYKEAVARFLEVKDDDDDDDDDDDGDDEAATRRAVITIARRAAMATLEFLAKLEPPVVVTPDPDGEMDGEIHSQPFAGEMPDGSVVEPWDEELRKQGAVPLY